MPSAERLFHAVHLGVFSSALRVEEYSTSGKRLSSSLSLSSQPTNQSGGGAGLPTVLWLNNNGEVNIAFLLVFIFFTRSNCRTRKASAMFQIITTIASQLKKKKLRSQLSVFCRLNTLWWIRGLSRIYCQLIWFKISQIN